MNRLFEIATELGDIVHKRFEIKQELDGAVNEIKRREAELMPAGGYPGSNPEQRKAAELAAKANDGILNAQNANKLSAEYRLGETEANREALVEERDAIRWTIRDREQAAVNGNGDWSVLDALNNQLADQSETPVEENKSLAYMDERARDDAAAAIRIAEMENLSAACQWELDSIALPISAWAARQRNDELMELHNAYEAKYHL